MEHLIIDDMSVPRLGMGTWQLTGSDATEAVATALDLGYRHIDTAQMYENEREVGRAIRDSGVPRDELFVTTKVWRESLDYESLLRTTEGSLQRLGLQRVDLLLVHWPNDEVPLEETMRALDATRDQGLTRGIGVSNFPPRLLAEAQEHSRHHLCCDQVEYHVYLGQGELLRRARDQHVMLTAYCPLARGEVADDPELKAIAGDIGRSPQQVALRWLLHQSGVVAIPKASSRGHLAENMAVFDFELSAEQIRRIDALPKSHRIIDPEFAPDWSLV